MYHGDGEGDRIQCGLQVPGEGEAAGVEVSGDTRACHVSKVEQEAEYNKGFLSAPSAGKNNGFGANLSHFPLGSVFLAGSDKTGDDEVVSGLLHPHNQYTINICWVRYDRSWAFWSMAQIKLVSNYEEVRRYIRSG